ncbi:MAG TPA: hypothetical protein VHQ47_10145 [Phycisphaerae bacterium]|jgi:hypothetical protein|nr:hypothetical protein [Phycisphaerae bacterium]
MSMHAGSRQQRAGHGSGWLGSTSAGATHEQDNNYQQHHANSTEYCHGGGIAERDSVNPDVEDAPSDADKVQPLIEKDNGGHEREQTSSADYHTENAC